VLTRLLRVGIYTAVYASVALFPNEAFWTTWYGGLIALVFYDLCYYWLHRAGHECAVFWAAHVVHHQSQAYKPVHRAAPDQQRRPAGLDLLPAYGAWPVYRRWCSASSR